MHVLPDWVVFTGHTQLLLPTIKVLGHEHALLANVRFPTHLVHELGVEHVKQFVILQLGEHRLFDSW